jgi:hypothetical protein
MVAPEHQELADMYCTSNTDEPAWKGEYESLVKGAPPELQALANNLEDIRLLSGGSVHGPASQYALEEVEQEREVEVQVEEERSVEPPPRAVPLGYRGLGADVRRFVERKHLNVSRSSYGVLSAFGAVGATDVGRKFGVSGQLSARVFVSPEWQRTIDRGKGKRLNNDMYIVSELYRVGEKIFTNLLISARRRLDCRSPGHRYGACRSR